MFSFLSEETGAVTVDWVVLTGALVGVGLATAAVVASGVNSAANATADEMARSSNIAEQWDRFGRNIGFENGLDGWLGGVLGTDPAYGNVLRGGGGSGQIAQHTFDIGANQDEAVITFDMHALDSWDGESFDIYVDNRHVASASFHQDTDGTTGTWVSDNDDYSISVASSSPRENTGFSETWSDQSFQMQVTVNDPGHEITVGFGSTLNQGIEDESWAVDNISVNGRS